MDIESKEYKAERWEELRREDLDAYRLEDIDPRLRAYVEGVRDHFDDHNLFEGLAVIKFLRLMRTKVFKPKKVQAFAAMYESLKFSGLKGRQRYKLTPIQYFSFASKLGFFDWEKVSEAPGRTETEAKAERGEPLLKGEGKRWKIEKDADGKTWRYELRRLVRRSIDFIPRKFSKTTSTASLALYEVLKGPNNAQAYTAANGYKQAQVCFKEISALVKQLDPKKKHFKTLRETLSWKQPNKLNKESFVECLTGGGETKDGLAASLVIFDEYAAAKYVRGHSDGAELLMVLESSMGTRPEPLTCIITTASRVPDGPFALELDNAKRVLLGEWDDDSLFALLLMPDAYDEDYGDPTVWGKCNPHIGVTVQPNYYAKEWEKAQHNAEQMIEFRTKLLNVFESGQLKTWISRRQAERLQRDFTLEDCQGLPEAMVGVDLSVSDDFSTVVYNIRDRATGVFYCWLDCYIPEETLINHANRLLYEVWVNAGWLKVCPGAVIDYKMIVEDILAARKKVQILQIGYDPAKAEILVNALRAAVQGSGRDPAQVLIPVPQSYMSFTAPTETLEYAAKSQPPKMALSRSPIWPYCFANAYLDETKNGNGLKKPIKEKENLKIDPVIGAIETFWLWGKFKRTAQPGGVKKEE